MTESSTTLDEFDKELVRLGRELEGVLEGCQGNNRQDQAARDRPRNRSRQNRGSQTNDREIRRGGADTSQGERGAENARSQAEQKISDLHQSVSDSKEDLKGPLERKKRPGRPSSLGTSTEGTSTGRVERQQRRNSQRAMHSPKHNWIMTGRTKDPKSPLRNLLTSSNHSRQPNSRGTTTPYWGRI